MDPLFLITKVVTEVTNDYFVRRLRRRDVAFIIPVGVAYWMAYSGAVYLLRGLAAYQSVAAVTGNPSPFAPSRLLLGVIVGVLLATVLAFAQVGPEGIPRGLTLGMAVAPPLVFGCLMSVAAVDLAHRTGSISFAVVWLVLSTLDALAVSLLLRKLRLA